VTDPIEPLREALAKRYEFEREIGQGAYATVYRAVDLRHDRLVAIKVLNVDPASDVAEQRFVREIKWLARLQHPNILPLHDSGHIGDRLYFVTPYLSGESLRDKIHRERRLPVRDAVAIAREVADALQYAHGSGIIHRDIKPENILLSGSHPIVADFGVARAIDTARGKQLTGTGPGSPGTPAYMSPEQLLAGKNVDHRSDIYSLGCVLWEMLTGKPPFAGKEGFVRRFTEPPPSARQPRPDIPAWLDDVLAKALATEPAQRFATALEFARALERGATADATLAKRVDSPHPVSASTSAAPAALTAAAPAPVQQESLSPPPASPPPPPTHDRARLAALVTVLVAVLAVASFLAVRGARRPTLDENLLAVAPFSLFGVDTVWREGLVDVLVRNLDGAGPLRTVPAASSIRRWSGFADRPSAENLGRALHARLVVFGSVMRAGTDSVRLTATVTDVRDGRALPELRWQDASVHIDRLTDSVTFGVLRQIGERLGIRSLSHVPIASTTTLAALKEYLQGEQHLRRTAWDSALAAYKRATELDSTFTLALWRTGVVLFWLAHAHEDDAYKLRAGAHNRRLGPRDSLLVAADSLFAAANVTTDNAHVWRLVRRLHATLEEATRRYSDDAEVWWARADALFHFTSPPGTVSVRQLLAMLGRGIALDTNFAPPYLHAIELALEMGDDTLARHYVRAYLELGAADTTAVRIVRAVMDDGVASEAAGAAITSAPLEDRYLAYYMLALWPDSAEAPVGLARRMLAISMANAGESQQATARVQLARVLAVRGHLREGYHILKQADADTSPSTQRLVGDLAFLGVISLDTAHVLIQRWRRFDRLAPRWMVPALGERRDSIAIAGLLRDATSITADSARSGAARRTNATYSSASARAFLALASGDTSAAHTLFDDLPDSLCQLCFTDRFVRLQLLRSAGRFRDIARLTTERLNRQRTPITVLFAVEEARAAIQLGDITTAREAYGRVAAMWRHPDPELEPYVREARDALSRASGR
jgi:serine/threonine-protein kinase